MKALIISMVSYYLLLWFSDIVIGQMITGIVTIVIALIAYRTNVRLKKMEEKVDGRLSLLLEFAKSDERQKGIIAGLKQGREEHEDDRKQKRSEDRADKIDSVILPSSSPEPPPVKVVIAEPADVKIVEDKTKTEDTKGKK